MQITKSIKEYFTHLSKYGYIKETEIKRLVVLCLLYDLQHNDFSQFNTEEDIDLFKRLERKLICSSCILQ